MAFKIVVFLAFFTVNIFSQNLNIPESIDLEEKDDYVKTEKFLFECIDLIQTTPVNDKNDEIKLALSFTTKWIMGCPYISINVTSLMTSISEPNPTFIIVYWGGWVKKSIYNSYDISDLDGNYSGIKSVLEYYNKNTEIDRVELLDELSNLKDDELLSWVEAELEKLNKK